MEGVGSTLHWYKLCRPIATAAARMIIYSHVHHVRPQAVPSYASLSAQTIHVYVCIYLEYNSFIVTRINSFLTF